MPHTLKYLKEFESILKDYQIPSDNPVLKASRLVLLIGASATGRDAITTELVKTGKYRHLISNTTRAKRINNGVMERDGVEYWFRSEAEMLDDLRSHKMLEAEIIHDQQVSGISLSELAEAAKHHKIAITNVEFNIREIVTAKPDTTPIMVLPPSFKEGLNRLQKRGDLDLVEVRRRLTTAVKIYKAGLNWSIFNYVVNDNLQNAVQHVEAIVLKKQTPVDQTKAHMLLRQLISETDEWLKKTA